MTEQITIVENQITSKNYILIQDPKILQEFQATVNFENINVKKTDKNISVTFDNKIKVTCNVPFVGLGTQSNFTNMQYKKIDLPLKPKDFLPIQLQTSFRYNAQNIYTRTEKQLATKDPKYDFLKNTKYGLFSKDKIAGQLSVADVDQEQIEIVNGFFNEVMTQLHQIVIENIVKGTKLPKGLTETKLRSNETYKSVYDQQENEETKNKFTNIKLKFQKVFNKENMNLSGVTQTYNQILKRAKLPEITEDDLISSNKYTGKNKIELNPENLYFVEHKAKFAKSALKIKIPLMTEEAIAAMLVQNYSSHIYTVQFIPQISYGVRKDLLVYQVNNSIAAIIKIEKSGIDQEKDEFCQNQLIFDSEDEDGDEPCDDKTKKTVIDSEEEYDPQKDQ